MTEGNQMVCALVLSQTCFETWEQTSWKILVKGCGHQISDVRNFKAFFRLQIIIYIKAAFLEDFMVLVYIYIRLCQITPDFLACCTLAGQAKLVDPRLALQKQSWWTEKYHLVFSLVHARKLKDHVEIFRHFFGHFFDYFFLKILWTLYRGDLSGESWAGQAK